MKCLVPESLAPSRQLALVFEPRAKRGQKAWNALHIDTKTLAVLLFEPEFFARGETKQQDRFGKEHDWKSKPTPKRAQCKCSNARKSPSLRRQHRRNHDMRLDVFHHALVRVHIGGAASVLNGPPQRNRRPWR